MRVARLFTNPERSVLAVGVLAAALAAGCAPMDARGAIEQVWPAFALVVGLLLIGIVADDDGLFQLVGERLGELAPGGVSLFVGGALLIGAVSAVLNLDTAAAFLTPVLLYCARSRRQDEAPLLVASILLANAGSLLLPGSNLTNLIVLGGHTTGAAFLARTWPAALAAFVCTAVGLGLLERHKLTAQRPTRAPVALRRRSSLVAVVAAAVLMVVLRDAAPFVLGIGIALVAVHVGRRDATVRAVADRLGVGVIVGLLGLAVALGTLGRTTSLGTTLVAHASTWAAAGIAAVAAVVVNNLPAAALLSARHVRSPAALLVGLDVGPNLFLTGSLAWFVWLRAARGAGSDLRPSYAVGRGAVLAVVALVAACAALSLAGRA